MEKEFVPYELALKMKQLGFDEPCLAFWDGKNTDAFYFNNIRDASGDYAPFQKHDRLKWFGAPLYQQAFRWFRENHGLDYEIPYAGNKGEYHAFVEKYVYGNNRNSPSVFSYEDAQQECLVKLIEIVEQKEK